MQTPIESFTDFQLKLLLNHKTNKSSGTSMRLIRFSTVVLTMTLSAALHADAAQDEELDPQMLRIETGQYSALLGRASEAADILFAKQDDFDVDDKCGLGVKATALELLELRNKLSDKKQMLPKQALRMKWPAWVFEPPTECPSPKEIRRRLDWLAMQVELVTAAVCSAAEAKTGDTLICSVE
jgi:hypothetical protein